MSYTWSKRDEKTKVISRLRTKLLCVSKERKPTVSKKCESNSMEYQYIPVVADVNKKKIQISILVSPSLSLSLYIYIYMHTSWSIYIYIS